VSETTLRYTRAPLNKQTNLFSCFAFLTGCTLKSINQY